MAQANNLPTPALRLVCFLLVEFLQKWQQFAALFQIIVGLPAARIVVRVDVAEGGHGGFHARVLAGLNVPQVVADVQAVGRADVVILGRDQQAFRIRLALLHVVRTDDGPHPLVEVEPFQYRAGKAGGFVGDDTPGQLLGVEPVEQNICARTIEMNQIPTVDLPYVSGRVEDSTFGAYGGEIRFESFDFDR